MQNADFVIVMVLALLYVSFLGSYWSSEGRSFPFLLLSSGIFSAMVLKFIFMFEGKTPRTLSTTMTVLMVVIMFTHIIGVSYYTHKKYGEKEGHTKNELHI